ILTIWEQATAKAFSMGGLLFALSLQEQTSVLSAFSLEIVLPILTHLQQLQPDILWHCRVHSVIGRAIPLSILAYLFQDKQSLSFYNCQTLPVLRTPEVLARMVAVLENAEGNWSLEERAIVAQLLGRVGEQMPLALLARLCQDVTLDNGLRLAVAEALRDATIPVPQETFVTMLSDSETGLRCVALEGLARHGELPVDLLLAALHDPSYEVRRKALLVLLDQGISLPIELLQTLLYDNAGAVGGVAWDALRNMGQRVPLQLWLDALQHEQNHIRKYALESLKAYKDQLSAELLLEILALPKVESDVCADCMRALGLLDERAPLDPLLEALQDSNEHIRLSALDVLNQLQVSVSASILLPLLSSRVTGSQAAQTLASLAEEAPISALLEMARSGSPDSARSAIQALRLLYAYVPIEPVLELLESEKFNYDTWYLIQLLHERGVEIPPRFLLRAVEYYTHEQSQAAEIVSLLCKADSRVPLESLLRLAQAEGHEKLAVPEWIQQVFAVLYEQVSPTILTQALSKVDDDQWLAVSLLGLMQNEENTRLITSVAQDSAGDHLVRSEAIVVLSDAGVNLPLKYLLEATSWSIYEGMSWYLADTVERLGKQAPFEELLPLVSDDDYCLRQGVVQALIRIARDLPLEAILPLLEDQNELARYAALHILAAMRESAPLAVFTALFHDSAQTLDTRCAVLSALGELGTTAAVDVLVAALESDVPELRMPALLALKDNEWEIRRGGMRACREEGKEIPLEPLIRLLEDPDMQVIETTIDLCSDLGLLGM
ncbi:MAG TPA: HEAT repeat domain-containing protein, partial [Ktedonobacteraceae bacterium]|nr:HEAT repeat domain-containing protein [Ktedonobacteraceae bacterium]